ncbi:MAG: molybdopterin biosynthesis protein [Desulfobulbaceae bacterium DB1]|nr:MAG: molybdopterin biosynthesis protein [Desulfobulbaceae bacterium DB1]
MKRKIYLKMKTLEEAREIFLEKFISLSTGEEEIDSRQAAGRVTSCPVSARFSSPSFHGAAMDGLAVHALDTFGASDDSPVSLDIAGGQALPINTGHPLPPGKDAVIMIENVLLSDDRSQGVIRAPVYPWQNVRKAGEDIVATELLFPTNHRIAPADIGALLTAGCARVTVRKHPHVTIIPTGTELIDLENNEQEIPTGKTVESNSAVLAAMARQTGARVTVTPLVVDDYDNIIRHLRQAVDSATDLVVINAGSSAGSADYTVRIIEELGEVLVHGVTIMPGKPTILGAVNGKPVVGNPGYPVSAIISFEQFVLPLLAAMQGEEHEAPRRLAARLAKNMPSRAGMEEFRRMITGRIDDHFVTVPLKKGAGAITTLTRANSMLRIPQESEGLSKNSPVQVELLRPQRQIEKTILCTGSHDLTLDLIHDFLKKSHPSFPLCSTHVGSLGGIMAIREGMTHIAGSHLLDPESGDYNRSSIKRYLADQEITLITLVYRRQGFMVRPGNPKKIKDVHDLLRDDVTFINRQAGSGTRVLLDYELAKAGLKADAITGYDNEEYTHMAVAVSVLSGKADAGLGILAAARALKLDFVPVTEERYDLIIPSRFLELPMIRHLLHIINQDDFKKTVEAMGGYSTRETGHFLRI